MSAVEPEPEQRVKESYEVTATSAVLGHEPGSTFEALLPEIQEQRLIEGGAIRKKRKAKQANKSNPKTKE